MKRWPDLKSGFFYTKIIIIFRKTNCYYYFEIIQWEKEAKTQEKDESFNFKGAKI